MNDDRALIERSADRIRGELLETLKELDRRRDRATDVRYQLQQHAGLLIGVGAVAVLGLSAGLAVAVVRARTRRTLRRRDRVRALMRAWEHPRRLANQRPGKPLPAELARRLTLVAATAFMSQAAKRGAQRLLPAST